MSDIPNFILDKMHLIIPKYSSSFDGSEALLASGNVTEFIQRLKKIGIII
jgi:hypothetical protein